MISVARFVAGDALAIRLQQRQSDSLPWLARVEAARMWENSGQSFTVRDRAGHILCCAGAVAAHRGYASLWALYAEGLTGREWLMLADRTRQFIAGLPHGRIDAAVVAEDAAARRWAERCGLRFDVLLRDAAPDGGDMALYRRAK